MAFRNIADMKVKDLMTHGVVTIQMDVSILDVVKLLVSENIHAVVVVSDDGEAVGVISEIDIVKSFDEDFSKLMAKDIMSRNLKTVREDMKISDAAKIMKNNRIHRLLILNEKNKPIGILCAADIMRAINDIAKER
ncbi:MAG: hypothetical protein DRO92_03475 [Candidatus Altiarchaeales archaeon]|nr:MAG: hypothetical protein DRO92_03475 [Candidatus Altiarchaeales archaeon]